MSPGYVLSVIKICINSFPWNYVTYKGKFHGTFCVYGANTFKSLWRRSNVWRICFANSLKGRTNEKEKKHGWRVGAGGNERGKAISTSSFLSVSGGGQREGPTFWTSNLYIVSCRTQLTFHHWSVDWIPALIHKIDSCPGPALPTDSELQGPRNMQPN